MDAFEGGVLDLPDFYFMGDDYRYHFKPEAKHRFLDSLCERFNSGAKYNGHALKWDTVIEQKAIELSRFLIARSRILDFIDPVLILDRSDGMEFRKKILWLAPDVARKLRIGKSTLHYLRKNANNERPFMSYSKVRERLEVAALFG
jgi:CRISPR-associated protein Cas1